MHTPRAMSSVSTPAAIRFRGDVHSLRTDRRRVVVPRRPLRVPRAGAESDGDKRGGDDAEGQWPAEPPTWMVVAEKFAATAGDVARITKRAMSRRMGAGTSNASEAPPRRRKRVAVLGSGWAAHAMMKVADTDLLDVVVVSPRNYFLFTPMLPSACVGTVEFRSLVETVKVSNPLIQYVEAEVVDVDRTRKILTCVAPRDPFADPATSSCMPSSSADEDDGGEVGDGFSEASLEASLEGRETFEVPYDVAVVAVGERPATFGVPGVRQNCVFLKEIGDAAALRRRIVQCFELASIPGATETEVRNALSFCVVGGGATGVEFAGTLADFVRSDLAARYPAVADSAQVTLLQSQATVLTQFSAGLQGAAIGALEGAGVNVRLSVRVQEVRSDRAIIRNKEGEMEEIPFGMCVWSAGLDSRPLTERLVRQVGSAQHKFQRPRGSKKLAVDPWLRVVGADDLMALGDCSSLYGAPLPATAQVAAQQGAYAARLLNDSVRLGVGGELTSPPAAAPAPWQKKDALGGPLGPFHFLSLGLLAYVGDDRALTQFELGKSQRLRYEASGRFAFLLWKSVYVTKQVSFRNRVLILFDWMKTRVFGRDTSIF